ncbi:hypothetical protein VB711_09800 [Cronbergia sp. UHCC 0137]|uniref:hypothetical protein n=1 Tax=Cronbergia sp. UHCC 0137 TaxID=3110239 RepID=UPI002B1F05A0|nr:hypothetical protein [Cronbergia sp. UHCC 0137]MEA5618126.1 hypothetical protein [Cronbergia sp. UHCC 0137]
MSQQPKKSIEIQEIIGLKPQHFADLIRASQLIFDPTAGMTGRNLKVNWEDFGVPDAVADNLKELGQEYQYSSPHIPIEVIWSKLTTESRIWFIENKDKLWQFEEIFPALDED